MGMLKSREWKTWEWKSWHHNAGVENMGLEIVAPGCKAGNAGVEIAGEGKVWKAKVFKMCF